jgi:hypothetical protein
VTLTSRKRKAIISFTIAVIGILFLAAGVANILFKPEMIVERGTPQEAFWWAWGDRLSQMVGWIFYVFLAIYLIAFISIFWTREGRKRLLLLLFLLVLLLIFILNIPPKEPVAVPTLEGTPLTTYVPIDETPVPYTGIDITADQPPPILDWLVTAAAIVLALVAAGLLGLIIWGLSLRRKPESLTELISQQAQDALDALEAGGDFRDIVIRCYAQMSRVLLQERGLERHSDMTPHEFEFALKRMGFPDAPVHTLTHLFEEARYGSQLPSEQGVEMAVSSLRAIVDYVKTLSSQETEAIT